MHFQAIIRAGVSKARLVLGIDLTASNEWQGRRTFSGNCLHKIHLIRPAQIINPYQRVINIIGKTLKPFTDKEQLWAYGFGDSITKNKEVFNITGKNEPCEDFQDVLNKYNTMIRQVSLSGPTSFAPIIHRGMQHVIESGNLFHILVIIADGQMEDEDETVSAIVEASNFPLSIVLVGVGDGPWDRMEEFDDNLPARNKLKKKLFSVHVSHYMRKCHLVVGGGVCESKAINFLILVKFRTYIGIREEIWYVVVIISRTLHL